MSEVYHTSLPRSRDMKQYASVVTIIPSGRASRAIIEIAPLHRGLNNHRRTVSGRRTPIRSYFPTANPTLTGPCRSIYFLRHHTALASGCDSKGGSRHSAVSHRRSNYHMGSLALHHVRFYNALSALREDTYFMWGVQKTETTMQPGTALWQLCPEISTACLRI